MFDEDEYLKAMDCFQRARNEVNDLMVCVTACTHYPPSVADNLLEKRILLDRLMNVLKRLQASGPLLFLDDLFESAPEGGVKR